MAKLMRAFREFFQEHSRHWLERFQYKEAGPQLLMQAFLQRIINSGDRIEREQGRGRKRMDLLVIFDRNPDRSWSEKIFHRPEKFKEIEIQVWDM